MFKWLDMTIALMQLKLIENYWVSCLLLLYKWEKYVAVKWPVKCSDNDIIYYQISPIVIRTD